MNAPQTYAIVKDGIVQNVVLWDGDTPLEWPSGGEPQLIPEGAVGYVVGEAVPA